MTKKPRQTLSSLFLALLLVQPLHAGKKENEAIAVAAVAAGIAVIAALNNDCDNMTDYENYTIGTEMFTVPGSQMLNYKSNVCKKDFITVTRKPQNTAAYRFTVTPGKEVSYRELDNGHKHIGIAKTIVSGSDLITGKKSVQLYVDVDDSGTVVNTDAELTNLMGEKLFENGMLISPTQKTFSQEILYGGIEGHTIHLQYREFIGNYIRDSFTQDIVYDLSRGNTIQLKRFTIQILNADNTKITYIIKS